MTEGAEHSVTPNISYPEHLFHRSFLTIDSMPIKNLSTEFYSKNLKSQGNYINSKLNDPSLGLFFPLNICRVKMMLIR